MGVISPEGWIWKSEIGTHPGVGNPLGIDLSHSLSLGAESGQLDLSAAIEGPLAVVNCPLRRLVVLAEVE